jgi:hypothetical protein
MSRVVRAIFLSLTILAVLAFSGFGTTAVYADGETPAEEVHTEVSPDGSGGDQGKPGPGTTDNLENTKQDVLPKTPEAAQQPAAPEKSRPKDSTILATVPKNTRVTVLNSKGEPQPLGTQESVDALSTSDPIWCPATQTTPTPGANGCTQSFTSFTDLLTFLSQTTDPTFSGPGIIYVEQGAYRGPERTIDFNNFDLSNLSSFNLTIRGGWNTTDNTIDATTGTTFSNVHLVIGSSANPWGGSLTLENLNFGFTSSGQTNASGITLYSDIDINLDNIEVVNAGDDTGSGAELYAGRDVNIRDSNFDRNRTSGATIVAGENVAILNSSFHNANPNALRQITGLDITAGGSVSLSQVIANANRQVGADIQAGGFVAINESFFSRTQSVQGNDFFGYGLNVVSGDSIALNSVEANENFLWGAQLSAVNNIDIANSIFNSNTTEDVEFIDDTGLLILDANNVSIVNSTADNNRLIGATINARGDVAITGSSFSNNNGVTVDGFFGYGLQVITPGNIFINNVNASGNTLFGAHLESGLDTVVSDSTFSNQTSGNAADQTGRGLEIISNGNVFLQNVIIDGNQTFGANILAGGEVHLRNMTVTNNGTNGIEVETSCGNVFIFDGTYTGNGGYGLSILNSLLTTNGAPVFGGNGLGDVFNDPGTCVFAPATPLTPPTPPTPPQEPESPAQEPQAPVERQESLAQIVKHALMTKNVSRITKSAAAGSMVGGTSGMVTLNNLFGVASQGSQTASLFTGNYKFIYSGLEIIAIVPNAFSELALNRP